MKFFTKICCYAIFFLLKTKTVYTRLDFKMECAMIYVFYTVVVLSGVFFASAVLSVLRRRKWGENP
jgi:hypothetical protein